MTSSIEEQLTITVDVAFIQNHDKGWSLNEFLRKGRNARHACGKTVSFRIVFAQILPSFLVERFGPGLERNLAESRKAEAGIPDSGEIDFAFRCAGCRPSRRL